MFVITSSIEHNKKTVTVYYVGRGTGKDTIWSDKRTDSMDFLDRESAETLSEELVEITIVKQI